MPVGQISQIAIGKLQPNPANVRTHFKKQIIQIVRSIRQLGFRHRLAAEAKAHSPILKRANVTLAISKALRRYLGVELAVRSSKMRKTT